MKALMLLTVLAFASNATAEDRVPVLVELFTSEGCSSCPPADELLAKMAHDQPVAGATVVPLAFHVDYWNRLGWMDRFSTAQFTQRQRDYDAALKSQTYTPQMIVDGRQEFLGSDEALAKQAITEAARAAKATIEIDARATDSTHVEVRLKVSGSSQAPLWIAIAESDLHSDVQRGENAGRKLNHVAVVRRLEAVAKDSKPLTIELDKQWRRENLKVVAFAQDPKDMRILGVATAAIPSPAR